MLAQESSVMETSGNHTLLSHYQGSMKLYVCINILVHNLQLMASFKWF